MQVRAERCIWLLLQHVETFDYAGIYQCLHEEDGDSASRCTIMMPPDPVHLCRQLPHVCSMLHCLWRVLAVPS
jgi:hypothetical protein